MPPGEYETSDSFSGIGAPEPRSVHMRVWIVAGQHGAINNSLRKPLPLKRNHGAEDATIKLVM